MEGAIVEVSSIILDVVHSKVVGHETIMAEKEDGDMDGFPMSVVHACNIVIEVEATRTNRGNTDNESVH